MPAPPAAKPPSLPALRNSPFFIFRAFADQAPQVVGEFDDSGMDTIIGSHAVPTFDGVGELAKLVGDFLDVSPDIYGLGFGRGEIGLA